MENESYYQSYQEVGPHNRSTKSLETEDPKVLVDVLLREFSHTDSGRHDRFREQLAEWLGQISEEDYQRDGHVRDDLYEFF